MAAGNFEAARLLQELADLVKLEEGSPQSFRVRAYERAVVAVRDLVGPVADMTAEELEAVDGIGKSTARKIREYVATGSMARLEALREKYPPELVELTRIPGLGPKTVLLLRDRLGVGSVDELREAIANEQVRTLPGMGATSEEKIARAIERLGLHGKDRRTPIIKAMPVALDLVETLGELPQVKRIAYCGSLRRFRDTIGDVDILVASNDAGAVMDAFVGRSSVREVLGRGETKSAVLTTGGLQVDLRVVAPSQFGAALMYFTGSKEHNIELRQRAIDRGLLLNEYGLSDAESGAVVASRTEKAVYKALGLRFIPPEQREGIGEVAEAAAPRPSLSNVSVADVRGDLHVHSTWSGDGRSSLESMIAAASQRGLDYVAMTEHGEDLAINGLSRDEVRREAAALDRLREAHPGLTILHGAELNIASDGGLDYDPDFLGRFDWCVASVHSHFDLTAQQQTERVVAAMQSPAVNAIGHLTGRRIGKRPGIDLDVDTVLEAAAATGTAIEINSHLDRLDAPAEILRRGLDITGLRFVISTDSHHTSELANVEWGVSLARRGRVDRRRIVNTWDREKFSSWAAAKREL
jgi:DNA polymerase (family 10)